VTNAFTLRGVAKDYPGFRLGPLDLEMKAGTATALVGPNGAGKTTLMDMLAGILRPTVGEVAVLGQSIAGGDHTWKAHVGYASEQHPFYEQWTARANLDFLAPYYPSWSPEFQQRLVERFGLPIEKRVATLSKGNRVKLALIAALAHRPRLLLLDEPTAGLDPLVRSEVLDTLWELLADDEFTVLYSTHILSDVGRLADEIVFIRDGHVLMRTTRDDLERDWRQVSFLLPGGALPPPVMDSLLDHSVRDGVHLAVSRDFERTSDQLRALGATRIEAQRLNLEEIAVRVLRGGADATRATPLPGGHIPAVESSSGGDVHVSRS